ncbi:arginase [Quadrisphaera granulorum]|uniref:Arginase n=1 Tax=Quadrisphaera granulorum TaxID=317664 RepID=A0A315ZPQ8_9ACTN|nr:arginase family protein [Quadrisphaera granulorum]PWJ47615.1 arginase [Quadrisphaera granulorum]SZE98745.1 arginase [Quadrisphaera granulorum]
MITPAFDADLLLVVPLWQGGGHPGVADGATALADLVDPSGDHMLVDAPARPAQAPDPTNTAVSEPDAHGAVVALHAVSEHLHLTAAALREKNPQRLLLLGGDCSTDIPAVSHLHRQHPDLHVAWVDAHADLNTPQTSPSGRAHGMPLRTLLGEGHPDLLPGSPTDATSNHAPHPQLHPSRCLLVGTHDLDDAEADYIRDHDLQLLSPQRLRELNDLQQRVERWLPGGAPLHIHLDLDVLDPQAFPAVACPTPNGLSVAELIDVLTVLRQRGDLVGVTITEHVPALPHSAEVLPAVLDALGITHR